MIDIKDIPLLKDIHQSELNIEKRNRVNPLPWKGQFSPGLVEVLVNRFATDNDVILDPFVGSGTVLYECARFGIEGTGIEINPAAYILSKIYTLCNLPPRERHEIVNYVYKNIISIFLNNLNVQKLDNFISNLPTEIQNIIEAWVILADLNSNNSPSIMLKSWQKLYKLILSLPFSEKRIKVILSDARCIPLDDNLFSIVITSPPYVNVINYHQQYRKSVEFLGYNILDIAKSEIGSNRKNRSNRFLTVIQYAIDMTFVLKELCRVCKPSSKLIFVIGRESSIKGVKICNSEIIATLFHIMNIKLEGRYERLYMNRYGKKICEDILIGTVKKTDNKRSTDNIVNIGRSIGIGILHKISKSLHIDSKTKNLIEDAIESVDNVQPSPIMERDYVATS